MELFTTLLILLLLFQGTIASYDHFPNSTTTLMFTAQLASTVEVVISSAASNSCNFSSGLRYTTLTNYTTAASILVVSRLTCTLGQQCLDSGSTVVNTAALVSETSSCRFLTSSSTRVSSSKDEATTLPPTSYSTAENLSSGSTPAFAVLYTPNLTGKTLTTRLLRTLTLTVQQENSPTSSPQSDLTPYGASGLLTNGTSIGGYQIIKSIFANITVFVPGNSNLDESTALQPSPPPPCSTLTISRSNISTTALKGLASSVESSQTTPITNSTPPVQPVDAPGTSTTTMIISLQPSTVSIISAATFTSPTVATLAHIATSTATTSDSVLTGVAAGRKPCHVFIWLASLATIFERAKAKAATTTTSTLPCSTHATCTTVIINSIGKITVPLPTDSCIPDGCFIPSPDTPGTGVKVHIPRIMLLLAKFFELARCETISTAQFKPTVTLLQAITETLNVSKTITLHRVNVTTAFPSLTATASNIEFAANSSSATSTSGLDTTTSIQTETFPGQAAFTSTSCLMLLVVAVMIL